MSASSATGRGPVDAPPGTPGTTPSHMSEGSR